MLISPIHDFSSVVLLFVGRTAVHHEPHSHVRRLHSENEATKLWWNWAGDGDTSAATDDATTRGHGQYFDVVMHLRPDLLYDRVNVEEIVAIARGPDDRVHVGDFDHSK